MFKNITFKAQSCFPTTFAYWFSISIKIADTATLLHSYKSVLDHNNIQMTVDLLFRNIKFTSAQTAILFSHSTRAFGLFFSLEYVFILSQSSSLCLIL